MTKYRTIVADPPWHVTRLASPGAEGFGTQSAPLRSVALPYPTMTVDEIADLPVREMVDRSAHLYVWTINAYVEDTYEIARLWGFRPSALLTWCKTPMGIGPGGTFSQTTEHVLFARRGICKAAERVDSTWWQWPRGGHSRKPDAFLDLVERISPEPRLEMFARRQRLGWDTWGNEALNHVEIEAPA
jgi:N6-adenosine-specific RNA methylase IME4